MIRRCSCGNRWPAEMQPCCLENLRLPWTPWKQCTLFWSWVQMHRLWTIRATTRSITASSNSCAVIKNRLKQFLTHFVTPAQKGSTATIDLFKALKEKNLRAFYTAIEKG